MVLCDRGRVATACVEQVLLSTHVIAEHCRAVQASIVGGGDPTGATKAGSVVKDAMTAMSGSVKIAWHAGSRLKTLSPRCARDRWRT